MKKILVAYATNSGTTSNVAHIIGEEIEKSGAKVDVLPLEEITNLEGYDAVVIGAPMIVGWHRAALSFIKKQQAMLARIPVGLFITCINLTQTDETQVDGIPVTVDPRLAKPPVHKDRLSFKERYATVTNYVRPLIKAAPQVKPVNIGIFGGRLDIYRLKWWQALFVMVVIQAQPGEKRNWEAIKAWAGQLANSVN